MSSDSLILFCALVVGSHILYWIAQYFGLRIRRQNQCSIFLEELAKTGESTVDIYLTSPTGQVDLCFSEVPTTYSPEDNQFKLDVEHLWDDYPFQPIELEGSVIMLNPSGTEHDSELACLFDTSIFIDDKKTLLGIIENPYTQQEMSSMLRKVYLNNAQVAGKATKKQLLTRLL